MKIIDINIDIIWDLDRASGEQLRYALTITKKAANGRLVRDMEVCTEYKHAAEKARYLLPGWVDSDAA